MTQTTPKPLSVQARANLDDEPGVWLFLSGTQVAGRIEADCAACALARGTKQWPNSEMALLFSRAATEALAERGCLRLAEHWTQRRKREIDGQSRR